MIRIFQGSEGFESMEDFSQQLSFAPHCVSVHKDKVALNGKGGVWVVDTMSKTTTKTPWASPGKVSWNHRVIRNGSKRETGKVVWNKISESLELAASSGEQLEIYDVDAGLVKAKLRSHLRPIVDIEYSRCNPNLLITCSPESLIHIWDTRLGTQPANTISTYSGAHLLRWCPCKDIIASAHDGELHIWDLRMPDYSAIQLLTAHTNQISSMDWSRTFDDLILTSGARDCAIKIWSINAPKLPQHQVLVQHPVKQLQWTPFGDGFISVASKSDCNIRLWAPDFHSQEIHNTHVLKGHKSPVISFDFHIQQNSQKSTFHLVTLSSQYSLKHWTFDQNMIDSVKNADSFPEIGSFVDECNLIKKEMQDKVTVTGLDEEERIATFVFKVGISASLVLNMYYPLAYPTTPPTIKLIPSNQFKSTDVELWMKELLALSEECAKKHIFSTAQIILLLIRLCKQNSSHRKSRPTQLITNHASVTPSPRTCAGIWGSSGDFVYFRCGASVNKKVKTYEDFQNSSHSETMEILLRQRQNQHYFENIFGDHEDPINSPKQSYSRNQPFTQLYICDFKSLLPISYKLSQNLTISKLKTFEETCQLLIRTCMEEECYVAANLWGIISLIARPELFQNQNDNSWETHPCGRRLIKKLLLEFLQMRDVQTISYLGSILRIFGQEKLFDRETQNICNLSINCYSEILKSWEFNSKRSEIFKYGSETMESSEACINIDNLQCSICHLPVTGLSMFCINCGHGGHVTHMLSWFSQHSECPTGCTCHCIDYLSNIGNSPMRHVVPTSKPTIQNPLKFHDSVEHVNTMEITSRKNLTHPEVPKESKRKNLLSTLFWQT